jgi:hypothetical protein
MDDSGTHTDTDPLLKISLGQSIDLGNSTQGNNYSWSNFAMNITLSRLDHKPVLPGQKNSTEVVSVVCTESHSILPIP